MKKITFLLLTLIMSLGASGQNEVLFDGSATPDGQQLFRQGASFVGAGSYKGITDDGSGTNNIIEVERTTNAGALWQVLPLVDAANQGVARSIGNGGTFAGLRLRVRTTKNGNATISARLQDGTVRATDVTVTGGDGTNFGAWQTIILNFTSITAENKRPEFYVDPWDVSGTLPTAAYKIQFDDIEAITLSTLSTKSIELNTVGVYPNPTTNNITINSNEEFNSVAIYNLLGKQVKSFKNTNKLNVSDLATGIYLLKTDTGLLSKFVKK